jgi:hypothetical protein
MKFKLIASDMDGTLVNDNSELTERTRNAIIKTVNAGVLFVTATGRPFMNIEIVNRLFDSVNPGVDADMPCIVFNGAAAYMGKSRKLLFERFLDFALAKEAYDIGQELGVAQIVWTGSRLWANRECEETIRYRNFSSGLEMTVIPDFDIIKSEGLEVSKVLWITESVKVSRLRHEMAAHFGERLNCVSSMAHFLEFVSRDAGKGLALAEIGRLYGIDRSEMIAVGDSYNDVSMLEYAGFSVAVDNSPEDIKEICNHVTLSNNNDGVAEVIERYILG